VCYISSYLSEHRYVYYNNPCRRKKSYLPTTEWRKWDKIIYFISKRISSFKKCIPLDIQQKLANDCIAYGKGDKPGIPSFFDGKTTRVMFNKDAVFDHIAYDEESNEKKLMN